MLSFSGRRIWFDYALVGYLFSNWAILYGKENWCMDFMSEIGGKARSWYERSEWLRYQA